MNTKQVACAVTASMLVGVCYAENGTFENVHCFSGQPQTLKHSDVNVANMSLNAGTVRATSPGQIFDNMSTQCMGLFGQVDGNVFSQGFCEWSDVDGDRFYFRYDRKGMEGTFQSVSGTGKYKKLKVDATYTVMRFPQRPGIIQGCVQNRGTWDRP